MVTADDRHKEVRFQGRIHPLTSAYLGLGCRGSRLSLSSRLLQLFFLPTKELEELYEH